MRFFNRKRKRPDHLADMGKQRVDENGVTWTLAQTVFAVWVETDDVDEAQLAMAQRLEQCFGHTEWDSDSRQEEAKGRNPYADPANTPRTHAGVGVEPAPHSENGPDSQAVSLCWDCGRPVTDDMAHTFCLTADAT